MQIETIFCDFVRAEHGSKHILVGVYPSDYVSVPALPGPVILSAYTRIRGLALGLHRFQFRFHSSSDPLTPTATFDTVAEVGQTELPTTLVIGPVELKVERPGFFAVRIEITDPRGNAIVYDAGRVLITKLV
jgi:hypothetical protein